MVDPAECVHPAFDHTGGTDDEGDVKYVGAACIECGADASAVYPLTHYLVFNGGDDPTEVPAAGYGEAEREALVTFYPQVWIGPAGDTLAAPADAHDPAHYLVPLSDAMRDGRVVEDDAHESDYLKDHDNAPEWVREWSGPFYVTVSEVR